MVPLFDFEDSWIESENPIFCFTEWFEDTLPRHVFCEKQHTLLDNH